MTSIDIREQKIIFDAPRAVVSRARVLRSSKFDLAHNGGEANPATHGGEHRRAAPRAPSEWTRQNADRILRYAAIVGRENVVAGTDCGLGDPGPMGTCLAKLRTLVEGARLASTSLWP